MKKSSNMLHLFRYTEKTRIQSSFLDLPAELILQITEYLPLCDTASLALATRSFIPILRFSWQLLNLPHNKGQKMLFLGKFDSINPHWILCPTCLMYHRWAGSSFSQLATWSHNYHETPYYYKIMVDEVLTVPQAYSRLVSRAKYYNAPEYGLPIKSLTMTSSSQGWTSMSEATWSKDQSLVFRITSMIRLRDVVSRSDLALRESGVLGGAALCECGNQRAHSQILSHLKAIYNECLRLRNSGPYLDSDLQLSKLWLSSSLQLRDIYCRSCGLVFEVGMHFFQKPCTPCLKMIRYKNGGLAQYFNRPPYSYLHDTVDLHTRDEEGTLIDPTIEEQHLLQNNSRL